MEEGNSPNQIEEDLENPLVRLVKKNLNSYSGLSKRKPSIYTVPERLRSSNEEAYSPKVVSIGPIHHGTNKPALLKMEAYKLFFFHQFLKRSKLRSLTDYAKMMEKREAELRSCYSDSETLKRLNSEEFLNIILVDATFIIEFLLRSYSDSPNKSETSNDFDYIFSKDSTWLLPDLQFDLLLLENQIPFFILVDLYHLINFNLSPIEELIHSHSKHILWGVEKTKWEDGNDIQHLLDFVWKLYAQQNIQSFPEYQKVEETCQNFPSTTQLNDCGVSFILDKSNNLFDIKFEEKRGVLHIPRLRIDDNTDMIFRNLIAYEQCNCDKKSLTNYISFIDILVNTQEDVHLLVETGIFESLLGDKEVVASLINKLGEGIVTNEDYFTQIAEQLDKYYKSSWHKWKANLKQNYFNNPWTIIAVVASVFLLLLTVMQTVYSVYSVYN